MQQQLLNTNLIKSLQHQPNNINTPTPRQTHH
jgi:hypothetical protein